jgi:hypothetical protein
MVPEATRPPGALEWGSGPSFRSSEGVVGAESVVMFRVAYVPSEDEVALSG